MIGIGASWEGLDLSEYLLIVQSASKKAPQKEGAGAVMPQAAN
jgi:hypothetical protein